jgi:hypothetical protein
MMEKIVNRIVLLILLTVGMVGRDCYGQNTNDIAPPERFDRIENVTDTVIFAFAETMPMFPGGELAFNTYLKMHLVYPETELLLQIQGTLFINFVVNTDGSICNVSLAKGIPGSPDLAKEAMRVIRTMPKWTPASMNRRNVRCSMCVPVKFALNNQSAIDSTALNIAPASYVGGEEAMKTYLKENMIYPDSAYDEEIEGTVEVRCIIEKDGSVSHPVLLDPYRTPRTLKREAIRLVGQMPKWNPALKDGIAVRSGATVPVEFISPSKKERRQGGKKN